MKKGIALLCLMALTIGFMVSCSKMDVGYLRTTGASFTPDSLNAFHNVDATSERGINKLPFVSTRIQGVAGTNPINYELFGVKADNQEQAQLFMKLYKEGKISVTGGSDLLSHKKLRNSWQTADIVSLLRCIIKTMR